MGRLVAGAVKAPLGLLACAIVAGVLLAVVSGQYAWRRPLGPRLAQAAPAVQAAGAQLPPALATIAAARVGTGGDGAAISEPASYAQAECQAAPMSLLVIGSDTREAGYGAGRADFIRAVRVDPTAGTVRLLAVPRDLYVSIPLGLSQAIPDRINTAYARGRASGLPAGGPSLLAATLQHNFGLSFDRYVVVNFDAFVAGVDALGGVDLELPQAVDGARQGLRQFPAGPQHLDGAALLDYVRIRYIDSDVHRGQRQDEVIKAMRARVLQPGAAPSAPALALALSRLVQTDLNAAEISQLACLGQRLPPEALSTLRIGWNEVTPHTTEQGAQVLLPRYDRVMTVIHAFTAP